MPIDLSGYCQNTLVVENFVPADCCLDLVAVLDSKMQNIESPIWSNDCAVKTQFCGLTTPKNRCELKNFIRIMVF